MSIPQDTDARPNGEPMGGDHGLEESESSQPAKSGDLGRTLSKRPNPGPLTKQDVRELAFKAAGVTPEKLGSEVITKTRELMNAKKVRVIPGRGDQPTTTIDVPDLSVQLGGTRLAGELSDLFSSKVTGVGGGKLEVVLVLPGWANVVGHLARSQPTGDEQAPGPDFIDAEPSD